MVKVGNSSCEFLKLTPLSRTSAIAGAVCALTILPRSPSGIKRMRLCGMAFCAEAALADSVIRLAESSTIARRIRVSPYQANSAPGNFSLGPLPCLVLLCDRNVTANLDRRGGRSPRSRLITAFRQVQSRAADGCPPSAAGDPASLPKSPSSKQFLQIRKQFE